LDVTTGWHAPQSGLEFYCPDPSGFFVSFFFSRKRKKNNALLTHIYNHQKCFYFLPNTIGVSMNRGSKPNLIATLIISGSLLVENTNKGGEI
jgi:hypothetical protein